MWAEEAPFPLVFPFAVASITGDLGTLSLALELILEEKLNFTQLTQYQLKIHATRILRVSWMFMPSYKYISDDQMKHAFMRLHKVAKLKLYRKACKSSFPI